MPKDGEQGRVMTSAFQSREWGFGFGLNTKREQAWINAKQDGKMHQDAEAAEAVARCKKPQKQPLKARCWTCNHVVLQMEGCMALLKNVHPEL
jgi:hypothetical protein